MSIRIGITCGDINGIGPEVLHKAISSNDWIDDIELIPIGPGLLFDTSSRWCIPFHGEQTPGQITTGASRTAIAAIKRATQGCLTGQLDAMVTAPVCKEGLSLTQCPFPGQTELISALAGTRRYGVMLMGKDLRILSATRRQPSHETTDTLPSETVQNAIELTGETLRWCGLENGRIGVCDLPGTNEAEAIRSAIEATRTRGFNVADPVPTDLLFPQCIENAYDAVVAMSHDQELALLQLPALERAVCLTVGLPFVRTAPDHGTDFDIADQGIASPDSMIAAIELAIELAGRDNPWAQPPTGALP